MTETLPHGYSSETHQLELSNAYQQNRVKMVLKILHILVLGMKVASALKGLTFTMLRVHSPKAQKRKNL